MNGDPRPDPRSAGHRSRVPGHAPSGSVPSGGPLASSRPRSIGGYAVVGTLGRGGMGVVHRCRDAMGREVALKTITTAALGRLDDRLRREAQAIARLRHQNIVGLIAVGEDEGRPYIVMDLVRGEALSATLKRNGPLPPARAAAIVRDVARALDHAHDHGVTHRDVKPANILIDEHGEPRLTDFGLAADASATTQLTATGQLVGTLHYMAPEQADGDRSGHGPHTDIWAAGAVLYACLTGRPPFEGGDVMQLLKKVLLDRPVAPRKLQPWIPEGLERIVLRCLEKEPGARWPSAEALAEALEPYAEGEDEVGDAVRVERRPVAIVAAAVGLAFAVLAIGYAWSSGHAPERPPVVVTAGGEAPIQRPIPRPEPPVRSTSGATANARDPQALIEEGTRLLRAFDARGALAIAEEARRLDPELPDAIWLAQSASRLLRDRARDEDLRALRTEGRQLYAARILQRRATPRDSVRAAELRLELGDPHGALEELRAIDPDPLAPDDRWDLHLFTAIATSLTHPDADDSTRAAVAILEPLKARMPMGHRVRGYLCELYYQRGMFEQAEGFLQTYLAASPGDDRARSLLREVRRALGRSGPNTESLRRLLTDAKSAFDAGDPARTRALADEAIALDDSSANAWYFRARADIALGAEQAEIDGSMSRAASLYAERRGAGAASATDLSRLAELLLFARQTGEALTLVSEALARTGPDALPRDELVTTTLIHANLLESIGSPDAALAALTALPDELCVGHSVRLHLARMLATRGRIDQAIDSARRYTEERPAAASGWSALIQCILARPSLSPRELWRPLDELAARDPDAALAACREIEARLVQESAGRRRVPPQLFQTRARCLEQLGRPDEAIAILREVLAAGRLRPGLETSINAELSRLERRGGDPDALDLSSTGVAELWSMSQDTLAIADPVAARQTNARLLARYVELAPTSPLDRGRMGVIAGRAGDRERAEETLLLLLRDTPASALGAERWAMHLTLVEALLAAPGASADTAQVERAIASIPAASELPLDDPIRWQRAALEFTLGRVDDATGTLEAYLAANPRDPRAWELAFRCAAARGDTARVFAISRAALDNGVIHSQYLIHRARWHSEAARFTSADQDYRRAVELADSPEPRARALALAARGAYDLGDAGGALAMLDGVRGSPPDPAASRLRPHLEALERGDPVELDAAIDRGTRALRVFDLEAAEALARVVRELDPGNPDAAWILWRVEAELRPGRDGDAAVIAYERYLARGSPEARDLARRGGLAPVVAAVREDSSFYDEAEKTLAEALARTDELHPDDHWDAVSAQARLVWSFHAESPLGAGEATAHAQALGILEAQPTRIPEAHRLRPFHARWLHGVGRTDEALDVLRTYVAIQPRDLFARETLESLESREDGR